MSGNTRLVGYVYLGGCRFRVWDNWPAVGRMMKLANLGGKAGEAEFRVFTWSVITSKDRQRFQRAAVLASKLRTPCSCGQCPDEVVHAARVAVGLIVRSGQHSDNPALAAYARDVEAAIWAYAAGNKQAFNDLAAAWEWRLAGVLVS